MTRVRFPSPAPFGVLCRALVVRVLLFFAGVLFGIGKCFHRRPFGSVVEHSLGKGEVAGPIPAKGTIFWSWRSVNFVVASQVDWFFVTSRS